MGAETDFFNYEKHPRAIQSWYEDQQFALTAYRIEIINASKLSKTSLPPKFIDLNADELKGYFEESIKELEYLFSFDVIAATEAILRKDFKDKIGTRKRSDITRQFRATHKRKATKYPLKMTSFRPGKI